MTNVEFKAREITGYVKFLLALFVLSAPATSAASDDAADEQDDRRCINSRAIRRTDVLDDVNIVFYLQGRKIYLNAMRAPCPGLSRDRRFSYGSYTRSLCEFDKINVLTDSGFGMIEGRTCKLGRFRLVTKEDVEYIYEQRDRLPEPERVEAPPIQELGPDDAEDVDPQN